MVQFIGLKFKPQI